MIIQITMVVNSNVYLLFKFSYISNQNLTNESYTGIFVTNSNTTLRLFTTEIQSNTDWVNYTTLKVDHYWDSK